MTQEIFKGIIHKINSINHNNNTHIELLCQQNSGKKQKIIDKSYHPYFYIILKENTNPNKNEIDKIKTQLNKIIEENTPEIQILNIELEKNKKYYSKQVNALRISYNNYKKTKELTTIIEEATQNNNTTTKNFKEILEDDIKIELKYMVDKQLLFNHKVQLELNKNTQIGQTIFATNIRKKELNELTRNFHDKICAFDIETEMKTETINMQKNEIISMSFYNENFQQVYLVSNQTIKTKKNIKTFKTEKEMLLEFWNFTKDFFILIGFNSNNFDLKYIIERSIINNIDLEKLAIKYKQKQNSYQVNHIVHIDLYEYFRYFLSRGNAIKLESYSLNNISKKYLNKEKININTDFIISQMNKQEITKLIEYNLHDSLLTYELFKKFELSIFDLSNLVPINLEDISSSSSSQIIEAFLIYNAKIENHLTPRKPNGQIKNFRSSKYAVGAFVFQPEMGLFNNIFVYDFRSLYPSIIAAYNICPTTILETKKDKKENEYFKVPMEKELENKLGQIYFTNTNIGLIPKNIKKILKERFEIKDKIKKTKGLEQEILKARSTSLKIIANSIYGYIGFSNARWYSHDSSQAITAYARNIIKNTINKIENQKCKIIYSDTDSVFFEQKNQTKNEIEDFINKLNKDFKDPIFLELDGFFDSGLFVGVKKRYALYSKANDKFKITGFETIRSDSTKIVKETQKKILKYLLKEQDINKAKNYFKEITNQLREHKIDKNKLIIQYKLAKNVNEYVQNAPHVTLAKRMIEQGKKIKKGMILQYIISTGNSNIANRAKSPEECKEYDAEYYINKHLIPSCEDFFKIFNIDVKKLTSKQNDLSNFW